MDKTTVLRKQEEFLFPSTINYYEEPLVLASAKGIWVTDIEGERYLDFFGGILTVSLGHCHEGVTAAIIEQLQRLQHTSTLYPNEQIVALAEKLAEVCPGGLKQSFLSSSGTEANETAIMLSKMHARGAGDIIALRHSYSGRSQLAINLCGHSPWRLLPSQVAGIKHAHAPYCYRCALGLEYPSCDMRCATDLEELIATETTGRIAAFIAEPILGVGGFIVPPKEYFEIAVEIVRRHGGIFICDEVQTGWGRTGGFMNGIEHYGVEPDIMTFAKGMANGLPIGATIATEEVAASLEGLSIATFGGNPVSMVAALATINTIEEEGVVERAAVLGEQLSKGLEALSERHPFIGEVRGMGLMQALEMVEDPETREPSPAIANALLEECRKEHMLVGKGGLYGNVLRLSPPMLITEAEVGDALDRLGRALDRI